MTKGKNQHAVILGRKGGKKKSERKARAARANGKLGGDPRKPKVAFVASDGVYETDGSEPQKISTPFTAESFRKMEQAIIERMTPLNSPSLTAHDPKSCRLYRCGRCKAAGHRDRNRGLL